MNKAIITTCFVFVFFGVAGPAMGQFPGDVFFQTPSVSVASGGSTTLEIQAFTGTTVAGGFHFELEFDADELEIEKIEAGDAAEFENALVSAASSGKLGVVTVNDTSLTDPFGTVSIANVTVKAKAAAGTTATLTITVKSFVDQASVKQSATGFAATITITSPSPGSKLKISEAPVRRDDSAEATEQALKLRRPGHTVKLMVGRWVGSEYIAEPVEVRTKDPNAASD